MVNEYHNFNDVQDKELQAWNRTCVAFNIATDEGLKVMSEYMNQFSEEERQAVKDMITRVKNDGYECTRTAINRDFQARRDPKQDYDVGSE